MKNIDVYTLILVSGVAIMVYASFSLFALGLYISLFGALGVWAYSGDE